MPSGVKMCYQCEGCKAGFTIENFYGLALNTLIGVLAVGVSGFLVLQGASNIWSIGAAVLVLLIGLFMFSRVFSDLNRRRRNPVRSDGLKR